MFEYADRALKDINRRNLRAFDKLKQLKFDDLNVIQSVTEVYAAAVRLAKKRFWQIAFDAYVYALILAGIDRKKAEEMAEDSITEDWILDMLEEYDPVTLYQFEPEADRKKQRLIEALIAAHNKNEEVDRALRLWTRQVSQYADKSVVEATIDAYKAAGVKEVKWIAVDDAKTCKTCEARDGKIYPIDKVPDRPHYYCRCELIPI